MADKEPTRRSFITLKALNPADGTTYDVLISYDRMQAVAKRSMAAAKECGFIVPTVLQSPASVFEGLCRDEDEDRRGVGWRCYCAVPECAYRLDGTRRATYPGQVYVVFINDERVAYNWRWEQADPDNPSLPADHATRFKRRLL